MMAISNIPNCSFKISEAIINKYGTLMDLFDVYQGLDHESDKDILLSECPISSKTIIRQVPDEDSEILVWLKNNGVILGQEMYIKSINNFDDSLVVEINNSLIEISSNISKLVYVTIE